MFIFLWFFQFLIDGFDGYYIARTPRENTSHAQRYRFYTRPDVRTGLPWKIPLNRAFRDHISHFAYGVQLWVNSLIPLTGRQYKMKEHREKSPIPFFLQTSLSLSYLLHISMLKELFGKALKCKNKKQEAGGKIKLKKKWKGNLLTGCLKQDKQERRRKL